MSPSIFSVGPHLRVGLASCLPFTTSREIRKLEAYATIRKLEAYATFAKAKIKLEDALLVNGFTVGGGFIRAMEVNNVLLFHLPCVVRRHIVNHGREVNDAVMRGTQDHS